MSEHTTVYDARALADLALGAARAAAELVRARAAAGVSVADTKTSGTDPVTEADRASEALVRAYVRERRPDDAFMGEEGNDEPGTSGVRWIIDPIDGTVNFLYGIRQYAVSVAAEVDGVVRAGVVLNVPLGIEYVATDQDGDLVAERDGEPLGVRAPAPLQQRLVYTGFSYEPERRALQAQAFVRLLPRVRDLRRIGSAALDLCAVAEGSADAYLEEGTHLWDRAAGDLVARAAGARTELVDGVGGLPLVLCAPEHGFEEFRAAVLEAGFAAPA